MDDLDDAVNDIISQLKQTTALSKRDPGDEVTRENLEEFIIKNSGKLINKTLNIVDDVQAYISSAPEAKDVAAFAELLKAASSSMEALNKVYISIEKNKNVKEVKQMDIESKERLNIADNQTKVLLSRDEIMKALIDDANKDDSKEDVIDV